MNCKIKSVLAAMIVALTASSTWAQDQIILSSSNYNPLEGTTIGRTIGEAAFTKAMYVWATANTPDEIAPQTVGYTDVTINSVVNHIPNSSAGIDLSYGVSAQTLQPGWTGAATSVFLLSGASDYNPTLVGPSPTTTRWDAVSSQTLGTPAASISDINAVAASVALDSNSPPNVTSSTTAFRGLENVNGGTNSSLTNGAGGTGIDPESATRNGRVYFLLGEVDLNVTAFGTAQLAVSVGSLGMFQGATDKSSAYTLDNDTVHVALAGDADLSGNVNQTDLNAVTGHWQQTGTGTWATGDFDYNGQTNQSDLNTVTGNWQKNINGTSSISSVPEPGSIVLLGLGSLALLAGGRKIRSRKEN